MSDLQRTPPVEFEAGFMVPGRSRHWHGKLLDHINDRNQRSCGHPAWLLSVRPELMSAIDDLANFNWPN